MKMHVKTTLSVLLLVTSGVATAQMDRTTPGAATTKGAGAAVAAPKADAAPMGEGEVKKVNKAGGTVTLAHGALPSGMPPMTMAYKVKDSAWLDQLKVGQKIRFATDPRDGGMTVLRYELVK